MAEITTQQKLQQLVNENTFNADGIKGKLIKLIEARKIEDAIQMFEDHSDVVEQAIKEYNPALHAINDRPDKPIRNRQDYKTHKLPLSTQSYINEVELFFLLGAPLKWEMQNPAEEQEGLKEAFQCFLDFLKDQHYDSKNRIVKRLAGAETECAKLYATYNDGFDKEGKPISKIKTIVLSKSGGYELRPLFNRYGDMKAFAVGCNLTTIDGDIMKHWDIYTAEKIYKCDASVLLNDNTRGWVVKEEENVIGKIPIIYFTQPKAWEGAQARIERIEEMDSKGADIVDYTDDPMLIVSSRVLGGGKNGKVDNSQGLAGAKEVGKMLQVTSKDDVVKYLEVPNQNEMKQQERENLFESIYLDTFTPDFTYKNVKGLGAISGAAITKANILGYIKRQNRTDIYDEAFERECSLILAILTKYKYLDVPALRDKIARLQIQHIYQDPAMGMDDNSEELARWAEMGGISLRTLIELNRNIKNKDAEYARVMSEKAAAQAQAMAITQQQQQQTTTEEGDE